MEDEGDVATAFTLARILSNIPTSRGARIWLLIEAKGFTQPAPGFAAVIERFYFGDNILPCFESGIPLLKNRLQELPDSDKIAIAFPDDGAWKRFHKQLQHFPTIICAKVREGDQRIVRIKEGDPRGRHVVIVDDLVQSGGTLVECQVPIFLHNPLFSILIFISCFVSHSFFILVFSSFKFASQRIRGEPRLEIKDFTRKSGIYSVEKQRKGGCPRKILANHGAAKISAYVTHGIFPNKSWERFESDNGGTACMNASPNFPVSRVSDTELRWNQSNDISSKVRSSNPSLYAFFLFPFRLFLLFYTGHPGAGLTYFWITDSCPLTVKEVMNKPPFEVLSLAGSIAAALQIGQLF
ncbi:hypothetical protein POTOM_037444 [Populus tomentosa]|uniref:Phosphoribosyltransferase domain-containing protein n=1 Tax=Populus tomentosa TaxID=118781 RepID=A0A8X7YXC7_POPTO|nr:hypothetical protein POTOM_037444 [Populus tomentosa]